MANHILQITHHQQTRGIPIKGKGSALKIQVTDQSTYQIFDAEGKLLANPEVKQAGSDLWVYLDRAATGQPDLILQDYLQHYPVTELSQLQRMYTTFATSSVSGASMELAPPLAPVLQSAVVLPKAATVALAAIGTVGAAAAIASAGKSGGKDDGGSKAPPADTSVRQPVVSLNPVGNINQKNATGKTTLSGSLKNIDSDVSELKVEVNINGKTQTV
ncbi:MAG: hypothetical protein Q4E77_02850, partial [Conchiformibius sp.]|nr:hypothetical protein [Conchiformibius sp.]